ncbi:MAG: hypothetical protein QNJ22_22445, partial [Desulfosarcinaceae bacterium]|nr:hypothetical protein [Desulfosarcinaceae bacterium]
ANRAGLIIKIEFLPWRRLRHHIEHDKADGAFAAFKIALVGSLCLFPGTAAALERLHALREARTRLSFLST